MQGLPQTLRCFFGQEAYFVPFCPCLLTLTCAGGRRPRWQVVTARYSKHSNQQIMFDDFVALSVRLRSTSERFRRLDRAGQGFATMSYDDFIAISMSC